MGLINDKWDRRFLELARHVSSWSKDPSTKVGAVIVDPDTLEVLSMGYNGFPRGVKDSPERLNDRPTKYKFVVHAEQNALINAGVGARGCFIYVWPSFGFPNICTECAKLAIQAGIEAGCGYKVDTHDPKFDAWQESLQVAKAMLSEAGVGWTQIEEL